MLEKTHDMYLGMIKMRRFYEHTPYLTSMAEKNIIIVPYIQAHHQ